MSKKKLGEQKQVERYYGKMRKDFQIKVSAYLKGYIVLNLETIKENKSNTLVKTSVIVLKFYHTSK